MNETKKDLNEETTKFRNEIIDFIDKKTCEKYITHYTSSSSLIKILENKTLRFSDALFLNDSSEGTVIFDYIQLNLDTRKYDISFKKAVSKKLEQLSFNQHKYHYMLCCFSLDEDNAGMWNYYTKSRNQDGYSLTFDLKELMLSL